MQANKATKLIKALVTAHPEMSQWKQLKKKYLELLIANGHKYTAENCKPEDKDFLIEIARLQKIRNEIKLLQDIKELLRTKEGYKPVFPGPRPDKKPDIQKKAQKDFVTPSHNKTPAMQKQKLSPKTPITKPEKKQAQKNQINQSKSRDFASSFFRSEVQDGIWAKKR